ncbi:MAG TPA: hypothetical protein VJ792_04195 [Candidatus Nitrosotalea sp.]|nr:hypothetical protein [Candidatus Nitrosotalea sp.]
MLPIQLFDKHFGRQLKSMYEAIDAMLDLKIAHPCALLLSTYTEVMGGLVTGKLKDAKAMRGNYEAFLQYLGASYVELHRKYDLYKHVRNKLVHEFSPRPSYIIWINTQISDKPGIEIMDGHLNIYLREYYRDFKAGVEKYKEGFNLNPTLINNFQTAIHIDWSDTLIEER